MVQGERILLLDLLDVLQTYSDEEYRLKQKDIIGLLEQHYDYENLYAKRKTVKNNLEKLLKHDQSTEQDKLLYEENTRATKLEKSGSGGEFTEYTDFGYSHEFTRPELYLIIDSLVFSKHIPHNQRKEIITKLEGLSSKQFNSRIAHISPSPRKELVNHELFLNIEMLDEAMTERKQVAFHYNMYTLDERAQLTLETRKDKHGMAREYIINAYQLVPANGHYYLICNNDKYDNLSNYRVDRISNIQVLDRKRKPLKNIIGHANSLDLANYIAEHIYMYAGKSVSASLRLKKVILSDFVDWFGTENVTFSKQTEEEVTARIKVNRKALRKWALQYALYVRVLSPEDVVEDIKRDIEQVRMNYE